MKVMKMDRQEQYSCLVGHIMTGMLMFLTYLPTFLQGCQLSSRLAKLENLHLDDLALRFQHVCVFFKDAVNRSGFLTSSYKTIRA
jgi:hypothetical protein